MGAILKPSDKQGCHIWYYRVADHLFDTQTSPPAVIPHMTERRLACSILNRTFLQNVTPSLGQIQSNLVIASLYP